MIDAWIRSCLESRRGCRPRSARARKVIADLDDTPPSSMDLMVFMQAFDELHMHLEELLAAADQVEHATGNDRKGSR